MRQLGTPLLGRVMPIEKFGKLAESNPTTPKERKAIIEQAGLLINHLYPHLPFKRDIFTFIPKKDLFVKARAAIRNLSEIAFQREMLDAFALVRDAHTTYGLPPPFSGALAFLPFQVETVVGPDGVRIFLVASVMNSEPAPMDSTDKPPGFGHPSFGPGAILVSWAGQPVAEHINRVAATVPGGNEAAWFRRGVVACTTRILTYSPLPFPNEMPVVEIVYRPPAPGAGGGPEQVIRLPWGVARFPVQPQIPRKSFSMSYVSAELNRATTRLHCRELMKERRRLRESTDERAVSRIPDVFEFQFTGGPQKTFPIDVAAALADPQHPNLRLGYLRIRSFNDHGEPSTMTVRLVKEAQRILTLLDREAPDGLVLDIRGNPGGDIEAAERILQMLTPGTIEPENFHLAQTKTIIRVLRGVRSMLRRKKLPKGDAAKLAAARVELEAWLDAADQPDPSARLTAGHPLTDPDLANAIGQVYQGRVVLLVDAATYSAADIFAAGFQDHAIGPILGADLATGGGGANVANHGDLINFLGPRPGIKLAPLPHDIFMRVAFRRCGRVGLNSGKPVEDFGVRVEKTYTTNLVADVLAGMPGMITEAAGLIGQQKLPSRIDAVDFKVKDDGVRVDLQVSPALAELHFFLDGAPVPPTLVKKGPPRSFLLPLPAGRSNPAQLRIEGFTVAGAPQGAAGRLDCVRTIDLRPPEATPEVAAAETTKRQRFRNRARLARARLRRRRK